MTPREFFDLVSKMRAAQAAYFKFRSMQALAKARNLEHEVDREITRVNTLLSERAKNEPTQKKLF